MKKYLPIVATGFTLVAAILIAPGCDTTTPPTQPTVTDSAPSLVPSPAPDAGMPGDKPVEGTGRTVTVFKMVEDADGNRSLKSETVPLPAGSVSSPATFALESLINAKDSPVPPGTKLLSMKISDDGVATTDFSHEFKDNFPGGDSQEAMVLNSLYATLAQFKTIKTSQILVEGKKIETLGGNQLIDVPISVTNEEDGGKDVP